MKQMDDEAVNRKPTQSVRGRERTNLDKEENMKRRVRDMILEAVILYVKPGQTLEFEADFRRASGIIRTMKGYISHELHKCMEQDHQYLLLVRWETLEDHIEGFRGSEGYQEWKSLLHHYYDPFPVVLHYTAVNLEE